MKDADVVFIGRDETWRDDYLSTCRRSTFLEPEKALLAALLQDAVDCYNKRATAQDREVQGKFREAQRWIMSDRDDWVFSFRNVCAVLGVDAEYIRRGIFQEKCGPPAGVRRYKHRRHAA